MNTESRFTKLDAEGNTLPLSTTDHAFFIDHLHGVIHPVAEVSDPTNWKDAGKACAAFRGLGRSDWRLPTPQEAIGALDYSRFNPAVDPTLRPGVKSAWHWTNAPVASAPSDCAWGVGFHYGAVSLDYQYHEARVRAVCSVVPAGQ